MDSCMKHEVQVKGGQHLAAAAPRLLSSLRDAAHLAQGFYVSANPTAGLPVAAELGVSALDSLASEMLLRGVLISSLAARKSALMAEIRTKILAARELQSLQQDARARLAPPALPPLPLPAAAE
ncbi:uncharacterized protein HaLaN_24621, partial [Haematococcus lacustris]